MDSVEHFDCFRIVVDSDMMSLQDSFQKVLKSLVQPQNQVFSMEQVELNDLQSYW